MRRTKDGDLRLARSWGGEQKTVIYDWPDHEEENKRRWFTTGQIMRRRTKDGDLRLARSWGGEQKTVIYGWPDHEEEYERWSTVKCNLWWEPWDVRGVWERQYLCKPDSSIPWDGRGHWSSPSAQLSLLAPRQRWPHLVNHLCLWAKQSEGRCVITTCLQPELLQPWQAV